MHAQTLIQSFTTIAEAPGGIQRLRKLVLDLAVRGWLVEQDRSEQPSTAALTKIAEHKAQAIREQSLRCRTAPAPDEPRVPSRVVPVGWTEVRLGDAFLIVMGNSPPGDSYNEQGDGVPLINGPVEFSPAPLGRTVLKQFTTAPTRLCKEGDLLVCVRGATTGRTNIAGFDACIGRGVALVRGWEVQPFVNLLMWNLGSQLLAAGKGTTFPSISQDDLAGLLVLIPPLDEQRRIVTKVNELMGLCAEVEEHQARRRRAATRFRSSALHALTEAQDPVNLRRAWDRVSTTWPALTEHPDSVPVLRQAVLQLAVQGRLVRQAETDGPASAAVEWARKEKNSIVGLRKQPPLSSVERPVGSLPAGWTWARVDDLFLVTGGIQKSAKRRPRENHFPYLRVANVQRGRLDLEEIERFELFDHELDRLRLLPGDLLVVEGNGSESEIGRCARWSGEIEDCVHQNHLIRCRPMLQDLEHYLLMFLNSPAGTATMRRLAVTTSGLYNLSVAKIRSIVFPLPPPAEQGRIRERVERLMRSCDELEDRLIEQQETQARLAMSATAAISV